MSEAEDSRSHYAAVAGSYTDCYFYQEGGEMEQWRVEIIMARLKSSTFSPQNYRILDVGGGRGRLAGLLHAALGLQLPVTCVDNSAAMLAEAGADPRILPVCRDGLSYASRLLPASLDAVLLCEVVHHLPAPALPAFYSNLYKALRPGGVVVTLTHPPTSAGYPFFAAAHRVWEGNTYLLAIFSSFQHSDPCNMPL